MAEIRIAAVKRAGAFSPNHIGNDTAILNLVADQLRKRGCEVRVYSEEELVEGAVLERIVINMCREHRSLEKLQQMEEEGRLVINSGYGIENCTRERMTRILVGSHIPYPESLIVNTDEAVRDRLVKSGYSRCWIKRGDFHTMHKEDVSFVRHAEEAQEVLQEYFLRGIRRAVVSKHLEGDLIKFYGIIGSPFFYWFYPFEEDYSKYGAEKINGHVHNLPFAENRLKTLCKEAAGALGVKIYGGDCIVSENGDIRIIDLNDWPSFAPCRAEAAPYIAKAIMAEIKKYNEEGKL